MKAMDGLAIVALYVVALCALAWLLDALLILLVARRLRRKGCDVSTHYGLSSLRVRGFDPQTRTLYRLRIGRTVPDEPYRGLRLVKEGEPARRDGWRS